MSVSFADTSDKNPIFGRCKYYVVGNYNENNNQNETVSEEKSQLNEYNFFGNLRQHKVLVVGGVVVLSVALLAARYFRR